MTINNVNIGDKFKTGKFTTAIVVDFRQSKSLITGDLYQVSCIAQAIGSATNTFETPFATVVRNRI